LPDQLAAGHPFEGGPSLTGLPSFQCGLRLFVRMDSSGKTALGTTSPSASDRDLHNRLDPHRRGPGISDVLLGGQDGLVNVLGVILGVAAATSSTRIVIVAGLAAAMAESVSMAAVAYTSTKADAEVYESEKAREMRHIEAVPHLEKDEIRQIYKKKGFDGDLLEKVVETITANKEVWVAVMMSEEHNLAIIEKGHALRSAVIVGVSAIVGSLVPLVPFIAMPVNSAMAASVVVAAATLFVMGIYKAHVTTGRWWKSGLELAAIGMAAALVGYLVGVLLGVQT
jgi:vacuolar iron transporter family protein